jgi:flagellar biosynthesis protein FlhG
MTPSNPDIDIDIDEEGMTIPPPGVEGESDAPASMRGVRRLIAVGGGRGGVGKSQIALNLAVYFAQLGKSVILVDADATGSNLHAHFGLSAARQEPSLEEQPGDLRKALVPTSVPGLELLPFAHDAVAAPLSLRAGRKSRWIGRLRALPAEYLVIDVGPGFGYLALDIMLSADIPVAVTVPEPPAVETTYRFLRAAFRRKLRRALLRDKFRLAMVERALTELGSLPSPVALVRALHKMDKTLADIAWREAQSLRVQLVVNQTRVRTDTELGNWMSGLCARHYGVKLEELGHVEHDDTVWLTVRRNKPLLVDSPTSKAARNVERIARRVLALTTARQERSERPPPMPETEPTLYAVLGVTRAANDEEIRRAYKRQREIYAVGGVATSSLLDVPQLETALARLDEAYDTLLDPVRRRAYDLSTFPEHEEPALSAKTSRPALAAEQLMLQAELAREIGPDTEFTGTLLRKVRESQGIELVEISEKTKIARMHLQAIEEEEYADLPALVYVRGFVTEYAKCLRLDHAQVQKTYVRRMREAMTTSRSDEG